MNKTNIKHKSINAMRWSASRTIIRFLFMFFVPIILARILTPNDFGLVAMTLVFAGLSQLFIDFGTGQAIIKNKIYDKKY